MSAPWTDLDALCAALRKTTSKGEAAALIATWDEPRPFWGQDEHIERADLGAVDVGGVAANDSGVR